MRRVVRWLVVMVLLGGGVVACSDGSGPTASARSTTTTSKATTTTAKASSPAGIDPRVPGTTWQVEAPAVDGMDAKKLAKVQDYAFQDDMHTQGVVVVRHGAIVGEWYAPGADQDSWTASWSVAKSFSSALVGLAIADGKVPSVDEPMATYLPSWKGTDREGITVEQILHMSSGLQWNEEYDPSSAESSDVVQMGLSADELAYAEARPLAVEPGTRWLYSSGDAMLVSEVIAKATGTSAAEYAKRKLFDPIEMEKADWWQDAKGHTLGYCCLDATARAYARFGLLYLHDGRWGEKQVVPASWVHDSIRNAPGEHPGYGYMWWLGDLEGVPNDLYFADGHDGQFICVIPSLDLVVVRTGTYVKDPGPSVADPNLFAKYPPDNLVPGKGTIDSGPFDLGTFLSLVVASVER
ncbi:MAG: serine hydrolase [Acidimicrobiales bacterium]